MAKINRPNVNIQAFASEALAGERTVFNGLTESDDIKDNINSSYRRGFGVVAPNEFPKLEDFNAVHFTQTQSLAYLYQAGVAEWTIEQEYHKNDLVSVDGRLYRSTVDNNIGNSPADDNAADWTSFDEVSTASTTLETSSQLKSMGTASEFLKVNTDNSATLFSSFILPAEDNDPISYNIVEEFSDTLNVFQGGKMVVQPIDQSRFAVLTQNELGIYEIDRTSRVINQIGNKLTTGFTTASNYDMTVVTGGTLDSDLDHVLIYNGDNENIEYYTFDGSDFVYVGAVYTTLTGNVQLARPEFFTQYFVAYEASTGTLHSMFFNGTAVLSDGVTDTQNLQPFDSIDDGVDSTIVAVDTAGNQAYILNNATSNLTQIGDTLDMSAYNGEFVVPTLTNSLFIGSYTDDTVTWVVASESEEEGFSYWSGLSAQTIGFDNEGLNITANNVQDAIRQVAQDICWPVGSVLENMFNKRNPAEYLGFGVWNRVQGATLFAISDTDPSFAANATGGQKEHTHSYDYVSESATDTLEVPRDGWGAIQNAQGEFPEPSVSGRLVTGSGDTENAEALESLAHAGNDLQVTTDGHTHTVTGETDPSSNLPPYVTVYTWYRVS